MPLVTGPKARTKKGIEQNIKKEIDTGRPPKQAAAIAYSIAGKKKTGSKKK